MEPKPHQKSAEEHRRFAEGEQAFRRSCRDLYEKMLWGLDADNFDKDENKKEAEALAQELGALFSDLKKDKSRRWADKIHDLEEFKSRFDEFLVKTGVIKEGEEKEAEEGGEKERPTGKSEEDGKQKKEKDEKKKQEDEAKKKQQEEAKKAKESTEKNGEQSEKDKKLAERVREAANLEELYGIIRGIGEIKSMDGEITFTPEELIKQMEGARAKMKAMTTEEFKTELISEDGAIRFVTRRFGIREKFVGFVMDEKISAKNTERNENRNKYAEEEYKTYNIVSKIQRFLGIKYDSKKVDSVDSHYNGYKIANTELLDLKLERLKRKGLDGEELKKEMGNLVKEFDIDEKMNVYAAHTDARGKVWEEKFGKAPGWIAEKCGKAINGYRKLPLKKKLLISAALFVTGGGIATLAGLAGVSSASLGFLGGKLLTGAVGTGVLSAFRGLGSATAGVGVAAALEARKINKENKKASQFSQEILKNAENETDKFAFIMNKLSAIDYQESFKIEKKSANIRRAAGIITSAGMFFLPRLIMEKMGFGGHVGQHAAGEHAPGGTALPGEDLASNAEKLVDLKPIGSGGSIEGSIIDYLKENPSLVEKYNELNGGRKFDAGQIAHRMFEEYGTKNTPYDLVHEGAQVNLSADGLRIENVTGDDHMGFLHEKVAGGVNAPTGAEDLQGGAEAATAENMRDRVGPNAWDAMDQSAAEESMRDRVGAQAWDAMNDQSAVPHEIVQPSPESFPPPGEATSLHETVQSPEEVIQPEATEVPEDVVSPEATVAPEEVVNPKVRVIPDEVAGPKVRVVPDNIIQSQAEMMPDADRVPGRSFNHNMDQFLNGTERELLDAERGYGGNYGPAMSPTPGPGVDSAWFEGTKFSRDILSDFSEKISAGNPEKALEVFHEKIAPDGAWGRIKDMSFSRATIEMGWDKDKKMEILFRNMKKIFGESIGPRNGVIGGETMEAWTERVTDTAMKQ